MKVLTLTSAVAVALTAQAVYAQNSAQTSSETMVVTATNHEVALDQAPASISVVSNEELNKIPATDISKALENIPGVHISKNSASEPKIIIRGLHNQNSSNGNYTLLLVNGRRISSSETIIRGAGFDLSSIPMSAIDHVEIVRGPMSSLYGSEAMGGVVNIILKQPTHDTSVAASLSYTRPEQGDGVTENAKAYISGANQAENLLYSLAVDVSDTNVWNPDDAGSNFIPQASQERKGINTHLSWLASERDTLTLDIGYLDDQRYFPDASNGSNDSDYNSKKTTAAFSHQRDWDWGESDVQYLFELSKVHEDHWHPLVGEGDMTQINHNLDGKTVLTFGDQHLLTSGIDLYSTDIDNSRNYTDTRRAQQAAIFAQDEYQLRENLALTLSGRYTRHDTFGSNVSPRAYLVWGASDNFTLKGGYGEGFKAPTIFQSSSDFALISCGGSCYLIGNEHLKPQTSKSYELSANYRAASWHVQSTLFLNNVKNLIDRDTTTTAGYAADGKRQIQYVNVDKVQTQGLELESTFYLSNTLELSTNATYTEAKNREDDSDIAYTPEWLVNANLNWQADENLALFTGMNYTGKQLDDSKNELDPYSIVQLGGSYQLNDNFTLKLGITNLFDKRLDEDDNMEYEDTEIGRSYYLNVDYKL